MQKKRDIVTRIFIALLLLLFPIGADILNNYTTFIAQSTFVFYPRLIGSFSLAILLGVLLALYICAVRKASKNKRIVICTCQICLLVVETVFLSFFRVGIGAYIACFLAVFLLVEMLFNKEEKQ